MMEAGCAVIGGHSVRDPEIKFGYSVTGSIHPQKVWANAGAKVGDRLIFTKAIGTGVISTAIKKGEAKPEWIEAATKSMTTLNAKAAEVAIASGATVHAATDITGFGLIGHLREMAAGSGVSVRIHAAAVPVLDGALECVRRGFVPGGLNANRDFAECLVEYEGHIPDEIKTILFDPQTAGGLLLSVAAGDAPNLVEALQSAGVGAAEIGEVTTSGKPLITVTA
jgi:selenide,water dikinase